MTYNIMRQTAVGEDREVKALTQSHTSLSYLAPVVPNHRNQHYSKCPCNRVQYGEI